MNKPVLILLLSIMNLSIYAQVPEGRYFENIEGTKWLASISIDSKTISELKDFGLSIMETEPDRPKSNSTIWSFNETLKIESIDAKTKQKTLVLECKYVHDHSRRTLKLLFDNHASEFTYTSVSTGAYIGFRKKKE